MLWFCSDCQAGAIGFPPRFFSFGGYFVHGETEDQTMDFWRHYFQTKPHFFGGIPL